MIDGRFDGGFAKTTAVVIVLLILGVIFFLFFQEISTKQISYLDFIDNLVATSTPITPKTIIAHIATPSPVKAVYITACTASESKLRDVVVRKLSGTEINSMVIDLKDYTGTISYAQTTVSNPKGSGCRIIDLPAFLAELHKAGIYTIGRITVFQDPLYSKAYPNIAVGSRSHPDRPWTDKNGLSYIDPDYPAYWDYIVAIAREGYSIGFDEINFDYIRFPSDGDMTDAHFALPASTTKAAVITSFFSYLRATLSSSLTTDNLSSSTDNLVMSADVFGQTTVNTDDLGIGQILENALPYFDYVAPMDYPSHFVNGYGGYTDPAAHPYEIVKNTMTSAVERAVLASSSPDKLRPWLQAFDLGAVYSPEMVQNEKQAVYDSGLSGWMLWNAASQYNVPELMPASTSPKLQAS